MRSEIEMFDLILGVASADERIRAVVMNGSRANPSAPRDMFQDYDIVYFVEDAAPLARNAEWIKRFGDMMILQTPDDMGDAPSEPGRGYAYLMQFMDGNRIDLTIAPFPMIGEITSDSQTIVLMDKDGRIGTLPPASDRDYRAKPPTDKAYADCCNEFWWLSAYVAKGLWRREILYAQNLLQYVREQLMKMVEWQVGMKSGYAAALGEYGKYAERHLDPERWDKLLATYPVAEYESAWNALFASCDLFRSIALEVAETGGFPYPRGDDARVSAHLARVRALPPDAKEIS
jgi:aminoglycoside 6-adenylyltransferase